MDPQIFQLINERSDRQDEMLDKITKLIEDHAKADEKYWTKIAVAEGQINLLKWMFGGTITTLIGSACAYIITNIKG